MTRRPLVQCTNAQTEPTQVKSQASSHEGTISTETMPVVTYVDDGGHGAVVDWLSVVGPHVRLLRQVNVTGHQAETAYTWSAQQSSSALLLLPLLSQLSTWWYYYLN